MKVAFNISPLLSGHRNRGIGVYTVNILEYLKKHKDLEIQEFKDINEVRKVDLIHYPYLDLFRASLPIKKKFKTVVTIHDVIPLIFPKHFPPGVKGSFNNLYQRLSLKSCRAVLTDSECSKNDIAEKLKFDRKKIHTVYLAPSPEFKKITDEQPLVKIRKKYNLPEKFILYYGGVNWNKNLLSIGEVAKSLEYNLVLAGKSFEQRDNLNHPELKSFKSFLEKFSKDPKVQILGFIEEKNLVGIINLAELTLFPSYYEGFGFGVLESQACGTPVIASNISSLPEIANNSTLLVDPYNIEEIKKITERILKDKSLKESLIKKGFLNVKRFSWEKTANETIDVYKQIYYEEIN